MNKFLLAVILIFNANLVAADGINTFHRLVVLNDEQEIFVVRIKEPGFWVTPGWYQDGQTGIGKGLINLASDYGLSIANPELKGVFSLQGEDGKIFSLRNVYVAKLTGYQPVMPDIIDAVSWLKLDKATALITFPHINMMLQQVIENPEQIWAGRIQRYKDGEQFKAKLVEPFYPL